MLRDGAVLVQASQMLDRERVDSPLDLLALLHLPALQRLLALPLPNLAHQPRFRHLRLAQLNADLEWQSYVLCCGVGLPHSVEPDYACAGSSDPCGSALALCRPSHLPQLASLMMQ